MRASLLEPVDDRSRTVSRSSMTGTELGERFSFAPEPAQGRSVPGHERDLPFLPVRLTFDDVTYFVESGEPAGLLAGLKARKAGYQGLPVDGAPTGANGKPMKQLLFGVSGVVQPGQVLAIMGPSGSGKTTLIDILAGRKTQGVINGEILFNGEPRSFFPRLFRRVAAYAPQEDVLMETLTVFETLSFAADLRLPSSMSKIARRARVEAVLEELMLTHIRDSTVGGLMIRGISGGEKKRLAIAVELITSPSLLYLDELTTGLSSTDALHVMSTINRIARGGRTVVTTIHQPRSSAYALFDQLLLLSRGRQMYFGGAADAAGYFAELGHPLPLGFNIADHVLDVITQEQSGGDHGTLGFKVGNSPAELVAIARAYKSSEAARVIEQELASPNNVPKTITAFAAESPELQKNYGSTFGGQLRVLIQRNLKNIARNRFLFRATLVQNIFFALIVGTLWSSLTVEAAQGKLMALFFIPTYLSLTVFSAAPSFIANRVLFNRERAAGSYLTLPYLLASIVTELPTYTLTSMVFASISYWLIGLNGDSSAFLFFMFSCVVHTNVAVSMVGMLSASCAKIEIAMAFAQLINTSSLLFSGFFCSRTNIPDYYSQFYYLSYHQWAISGLAMNEFEGSEDEAAIYRTLGLPAWGHETKWSCLIAMTMFLLFFRTVTFFSLRYKKTEKR